MKKFVVQITAFIVFTLIVIQLLLMSQKGYIISRASFKLPQSIKYIMIGNSHAETAYNDSLINNFQNLASSGESYFYSFIKLQIVLEQNPQVEKVYVEYTNLCVTLSNDRWIWEKEFMNNRVAQYYPFISMEQKMLLLRKNWMEYVNSESLALRTNMNRILSKDFDYSDELGGYNYLVRFKVDSLLKETKQLGVSEKNNKLKKSIFSIFYLKKIVELCEDKKVEIVFVRSPLHPLSKERFNENVFMDVKNSDFNRVKFLDFVDFKLINEEFGDSEHLNYKGAKEYSKWFNDNALE